MATAPYSFQPLRFQGNPASYNWADGRAAYYPKDAPNKYRSDSANIAYEWYRYSEATREKANPPFSSDAAGRLIEHIHVSGANPNGQPARILRGFIRRAETNAADPLSTSRLYFMYNPPSIVREYVNYLDQGALDPFNTVFQSENLVAPPSVMNFTFELFFDRQDEARDPNNPGVLVDMEMFDMVVRNVIPVPSLQPIPDNGVMMVNPRDITVVFSPEITVQGRPLNASVSYEKFTHRMVPTRMRIQLTMRVLYFGPLREMTTYTAAESVAAESVGFTSRADPDVPFTWGDLEWGATGENVARIIEAIQNAVASQTTATSAASGEGNAGALAHGKKRAAEFNTKYDKDGLRMDLWKHADCSSFAWGCWAELGMAESVGWPAWGASWAPSCADMHTTAQSSAATAKLWGYSGTDTKSVGIPKMQPGDLVLRINVGTSNHVAIVESASGSGFSVFHCASPSLNCTTSSYGIDGGNYTHAIRLLPRGGQSAASQNNDRSKV